MTCQGPVFSMGGGGGGKGGVKDFWDITLFSGGTERRGWGEGESVIPNRAQSGAI